MKLLKKEEDEEKRKRRMDEEEKEKEKLSPFPEPQPPPWKEQINQDTAYTEKAQNKSEKWNYIA